MNKHGCYFFHYNVDLKPSLANHLDVSVICPWDRCKGTAQGMIYCYCKSSWILQHFTNWTAAIKEGSSLCDLSILFKLIGIPDLKKDSKTVDEQLMWTEA